MTSTPFRSDCKLSARTTRWAWAALTAVLLSVSPALSGGDNPNECQLTSLTFAMTPADRTRTTIGVGEEVTITAPRVANWRVERGPGSVVVGGTVNPVTQVTSTVFTAGDLIAVSKVIAHFNDGTECMIIFKIIRPDTLSQSSPSPYYHRQNATGGGWYANAILALPTTVSFYNANIQEVSNGPSTPVVGVGTGIFTALNGVPHMGGLPWTFNQDNTCNSDMKDKVYISTPAGVIGAGTFRWDIPLVYSTLGGSGDHPVTNRSWPETANSDATGACLVAKPDIQHQFAPGEPTNLP